MMTKKQRLELEVFRELASGFKKWLEDDEKKPTDFFYYYDRPKDASTFWDTVKDLHGKGFLTEAALNTIVKYNEKVPSFRGKSYIDRPSLKEEENPISIAGKVYYKKLQRIEKNTDTPWYEKVNPLGAFFFKTWFGRIIVVVMLSWAGWTFKLTYQYYVILPKINQILTDILNELDIVKRALQL